MQQAPKPAEAPKPKSRNMVLAVIIVVILVVVGVSVYLLLPKPPPTSGTPISIWDNSGTCGNSSQCGYKNSTGGSILRITTGTTVTWTNSGTLPHTATACVSTNGQFSSAVSAGSCPSGGNLSGLQNFDSGSGGIAHGNTYSFTFNTAGNYSYYCSIHPWMKGTIIVS